MAAFGFGSAELAVLLMFLSGFGLPLGMPPEPQNPAMAHVAPAECLAYSSWAAMAKPDPESGNHTEQLLAEPELQQFMASMEQMFGHAMRSGGDEKSAELAPMFTRTLVTRATAMFVDHLALEGERLDVRGGMLIEARDDGPKLVAKLQALLKAEGLTPAEVMIDKAKFHRLAPSDRGLPLEITFGTEGNYLFLGFGAGSVEGMRERMAAKKTPAWLTAIEERWPMERRSTVSYLNVPELTKRALPAAGREGEKLAAVWGLQHVGPVMSVTGLDREGTVSHTFVDITGKPSGFLALLDGEGLTAKDLKHVPRDAMIAAGLSLDASQVYQAIEKLIADSSPRGAEEVRMVNQEFERAFGFELKGDVLPALGDVWTISLSPADGLLGVTASAEITDRRILRAVLRRAAMLMTNEGNWGEVQTSKFGEHEIQTVILPGAPLTPCWCLTETRLFAALSPTALKSALSAKPEELGLFSQPDLAKAFEGEGRVIGVSYQDTPKLFESVYGFAAMLGPMLDQMRYQPRRRPGEEPAWDASSLPSARSIHRHLKPALTVVRRTKEGLEIEAHQTLPPTNLAATAPASVALLIPAVRAAQESAQRSQSANNLKQIMLALHNYHDTYRGLPPAHTFADKKPGLSWRVLILPFIEEGKLYEEFRLDEPWDSEHNKKLIAKMPKTYRSPKSKAEEGKTVYLGVGGEDGAFPQPAPPVAGGKPLGLSLSAFLDGTSNSIGVVEASDDSAVIWTKPDDFTPDEKDPRKGLGGLYRGGFQVGLMDGSVRFFKDTIDPESLGSLFNRHDGMAVQIDD
jgi:hypothetical protein